MAIKVGGTTVIDDSRNLSANTAEFSTTGAITLPKGNSDEQPVSPVSGMIRYNTDNDRIEFYNGTSWGTSLTTINGKLYFLSNT